jgi:hypothetical protein
MNKKTLLGGLVIWHAQMLKMRVAIQFFFVIKYTTLHFCVMYMLSFVIARHRSSRLNNVYINHASLFSLTATNAEKIWLLIKDVLGAVFEQF